MSHSIVSLSRTVRLCGPWGGRWIGHWKDSMVDGLLICATLTGGRGGHTPFVQTRAETPDTGAEAVKSNQGYSWEGCSGGWGRCQVWKCGVLWSCLPTPHYIGTPPSAPHVCCCCWCVIDGGAMRWIWGLRHQTGAQYSVVKWTRARVAVCNVVAPASQLEPTNRLRSAMRDVSFLWSDSRCRQYVSDLSNATLRYLGSEKGRVSLLKLAFLLLWWKTADAFFVVLSFSFQVWRCSPSVALSLLSAPSTACQSPSAYMLAGSSAYAYFLEMVVGRSDMQMLKRRYTRTDQCGIPFLRCRYLVFWPFLVVKVKLWLPTISMMMWTMCLSGSNCSSLQVRPWCHTVL